MRSIVKVNDLLLDEYMAYRYPATSKITKSARFCDVSVLEQGKSLGRKLGLPTGIETERRKRKLLPKE